MDRWFEHLNEQISLAHDEVAVRETLERLTLEAGFNTYAYYCVRSDKPSAISNYAEEWQQRYFKRGYQSIDPIVLTGRSKFEAFAWSNATGTRMSKELRTFYGEAAEFGIRSGITVPLHVGFARRAMLTLASEDPLFAGRQPLNPVAAAAAFGQVHARIEMIRCDPLRVSADVVLKPHELTCLRWAAEGKTMHEIAAIENMSYSNVCFFILSARKTLGAVTVANATHLATDLGLI
jgi:LuxR family transcriptional activator of conjugal transfer of Ti plasmids